VTGRRHGRHLVRFFTSKSGKANQAPD
jgi:hypothetical protein